MRRAEAIPNCSDARRAERRAYQPTNKVRAVRDCECASVRGSPRAACPHPSQLPQSCRTHCGTTAARYAQFPRPACRETNGADYRATAPGEIFQADRSENTARRSRRTIQRAANATGASEKTCRQVLILQKAQQRFVLETSQCAQAYVSNR